MRQTYVRYIHRRTTVLVAAAAVMCSTIVGGTGAYAADPTPDPTALELANAVISRDAAVEGMVLLENRDAVLPMAVSGNVAVFGGGSYVTITGGTGSGQVNNRHTVSVREGLTNAGYAITTSPVYFDALKAAYADKYGAFAGAALRPAVNFASFEQPLTAESVKPTAATTTAIYVLSRDSGEARDRSSGQSDYLLADVERADLELIGKTYPNVIVVLNVGGIVDTSFFAQVNGNIKDPLGRTALDSLFLMSQAGQESGNALVNVLNGSVTPSGKLTDTWASKYSYYPASATLGTNDGDAFHEQYSEGVYVGYRYFDSFARTIDPSNINGVVNYPFGFGRSYTSFDIDAKSVRADMRTVTVRAKVTNTGHRYSGREVVQVYFSAPTRGMDKPYQELVGYAKTGVLEPGQSQLLTIEFPTTEMSSYSQADEAYVMSQGDYVIRVGNSSRNTHVAGKLRLAQQVVTEHLSTQLDDAAPASELHSNPAAFYRYRGEDEEIRRAAVTRLDPRRFTTLDNSSPVAQDVTVDATSAMYALDGSKISSTIAYLDKDETDWDGTGAPYQAKDGETIEYVETDPDYTLYDVETGRITMDQFVASLSFTQLANIVEGSPKKGSTLSAVGVAGNTTPIYENQGIPGISLADGPAGLRITKEINTGSATSYQYATAWPIGTLLAQTWDGDVVKAVATGLGKEMAHFGVTVWLAPGMNIHRDPLNGRNFEYYSEDPFLTGIVAAETTLGVQAAPGVGVTLKHYIANNQEAERSWTDAVISERASREIYLKGFEIAVKSGQPMAVMTSYNKVNGTYAAANYDLNEDILRGEWGFKGLVMSDWGAVPRAGLANTLYSGNDLVQPGNYPAEVFVAMKQVEPTLDTSGLPVYSQVWYSQSRVFRYTWMFGSLALTPDGPETFTKRVDASTDLSSPQSMISEVDAINNSVFKQHPPFASVDEAYDEVMAYLAPSHTALTDIQKSAITVSDVVRETPGDETSNVTAYTVTVKGNYPPLGYPLRLGDIQRSVKRILQVTMQSAPFAELAQLQGVSGVTVGSYSAQFDDLASYLDVNRGRVTGRRS